MTLVRTWEIISGKIEADYVVVSSCVVILQPWSLATPHLETIPPNECVIALSPLRISGLRRRVGKEQLSSLRRIRGRHH